MVATFSVFEPWQRADILLQRLVKPYTLLKNEDCSSVFVRISHFFWSYLGEVVIEDAIYVAF